MTPDNPASRTANALRDINRDLDETLLRLVARAGLEVAEAPVGPEWSVRQVLGHLAEFPHFFAADLRRWRVDRTAVVGRTHDHPQRLAAVSADGDPELSAAQFARHIRTAFGDLAQAMTELSDVDLDATTTNVKYGEEPMRSYLDRYILEHKTGHIAQLQRLLGEVDNT